MKVPVSHVGQRLRARRLALGLTIKALSSTSGVSARYITSAEAGKANLSLEKLGSICGALDIPVTWVVSTESRGHLDQLLLPRSSEELEEIAAWIRARFEGGERTVVALLGVRGAGKSAVGRALAAQWGATFIELDARVEAIADLSLAEIFALHGEGYYRRLEFEALTTVTEEHHKVVLATGGGLVTNDRAFSRLRQHTTTVWLEASAEDHWERVIRQGDRRPMRDHPQALAELRTLLADRAPLYRLADHIIATSGRSVDDVVDEIHQILCG